MPDALARDTLLRLADRYQMPRVREGFTPIVDALAADLVSLEGDLAGIVSGDRRKVASSARYLLVSGGKRVRPVVCLLASRAFGRGEPPAAVKRLAVVAEAVHSATLLHDDVIDLGDARRDRPAARLIYGNAASVLGGDLLLIQALRIVDEAGSPVLMTSLLDVLHRMIDAEALQLENRGRADVPAEDYFRVVDGKTASLFEWAVEAGGRLGGANEEQVGRLRRYGAAVGCAFQLLDDLLDLTRDPEAIGKSVLQDVGMGTVTWPVIHALDGRPELAARIAAAAKGEADAALTVDLLAAVAESGAVALTRQRIEEETASALDALHGLPPTPAREALGSVATALAERAR
jgi:octaprenyl-diphosphate synthase